MSEDEWLVASDPEIMLKFLNGRASERKLRLFAVACCRRLQTVVPFSSGQENAVTVAERYADGQVTAEELDAAGVYPWPSGVRTAGYAYWNAMEREANITMADSCAENAAWGIGEYAMLPADPNSDNPAFQRAYVEEERGQATVLRDILGPLPFRPITLPPFLLTPRIVRLAQVIYDGRHFGDMPVLADALEEPGCDNEEVLTHCRSEGPHVRGCWVVDLVLGKS